MDNNGTGGYQQQVVATPKRGRMLNNPATMTLFEQENAKARRLGNNPNYFIMAQSKTPMTDSARSELLKNQKMRSYIAPGVVMGAVAGALPAGAAAKFIKNTRMGLKPALISSGVAAGATAGALLGRASHKRVVDDINKAVGYSRVGVYGSKTRDQAAREMAQMIRDNKYKSKNVGIQLYNN